MVSGSFIDNRSFHVPVLVVVVFALYSQGLSAPFVFDDKASIVKNPQIRQIFPLHDTVKTFKGNPLAGRPLVAITFAINYSISGLKTWSYHLFNLCIHILNAILVMMLIRKIFDRISLVNWSKIISFVVAFLWVIHPINTIPVQYLTQRTELMVATFYLLTILFFWKGMENQGRSIWFMLSIAFCIFGMMCKEVMISAPLFVFLIDRQFYSSSFLKALKQRWLFYMGLASTWIPLIVILLSGPRSESVGFHHQVSSWNYLLTQSDVIINYFKFVFWPSPLLIHYEWPIVEHWTEVLLTGPLILILLFLTGYFLYKRRILGLAGAWIFMILAPTSSFIPIVTEIVAVRRMYLPSVAIIALTIAGAFFLYQRSEIFQNRAIQFAGGCSIVFIISILFSISFEAVSKFNTPKQLWKDVLKIYPRDLGAKNSLGNLYFREGHYEKARSYYRDAIKIDPRYERARINLAIIAIRQKHYKRAKKHLTAILAKNPDHGNALGHLGNIYFLQNKYEKAEFLYRKALGHVPIGDQFHNSLGLLLKRQGNYEQAIKQFKHVIQIFPERKKAWRNLALTLRQSGRYKESQRIYRRAIERFPKYSRLRVEYGELLLAMDKPLTASKQFSQALRLNDEASNLDLKKKLAKALQRAGKLKRAEQKYREILTDKPFDTTLRYKYARLLQGMNRHQMAKKQLQKILRIDPKNSEAKQLLQRVIDELNSNL